MSSIPSQHAAPVQVEYDRDEEEYDGPRVIMPKPEDIPDGIYHGQITLAQEAITPKTIERIIRYQMSILNGPAPLGFKFEFIRIIESVEDLRWAGGSLSQLGFDTHLWTVANGRPFRTELRKVLPRMVGMYVCFIKKVNKGGYGNIDFCSRLPGPPPRDPSMSVVHQAQAPESRHAAAAPATSAPNGPAPSRWPAAPAPASNQYPEDPPPASNSGYNDSEIPF